MDINSSAKIELLSTSSDIVHIMFYNLRRQVVLLSLKYEIVDGVIVVVCRIKTLLPRVSAPDIPTVKNVTVSTEAGSNKGSIDVIWEVSNMCLNLRKHMLPRRYCKHNTFINL